MDLTAKLPGEILIQVFDRLPSIRDQLRLESVSHRFQRCLLRMLKATELWAGSGQLNGCRLPPLLDWPAAVHSLTKKAKFSSLRIDTDVAVILTALLSSVKDCLGTVTRVQIGCGECSESLLKEVLAKCTRLSQLRLDADAARQMDLSVLLKEKALTRLDLSLPGYNQQQVIEIYQSLKPKTLKQIHLSFSYYYSTNVDVNGLMSELCGSAWANLEEIHIQCCVSNVRIDTLPSSLAHLRALRRCNLMLLDFQLDDQELVAVLASLFADHIAVTIELPSLHQEKCCPFVAFIRQLQAVRPELQVGFGPDGQKLTLAWDGLCFKFNDTLSCQSCFYANFIILLKKRADARARSSVQEVHLPNARLDRCRVNRNLVAHLNVPTGFTGSWFRWLAVEAELDGAGDLATITFETVEAPLGEFQITVDCGHCLANGCIGCAHVG